MFKAVIYVESPLQALNAMEYLYAEGLLNSFKYTFIINENKRVLKNNVAQIQHTISEFNLLHVNIIYINGNFFRFPDSSRKAPYNFFFHTNLFSRGFCLPNKVFILLTTNCALEEFQCLSDGNSMYTYGVKLSILRQIFLFISFKP